MTNDPMSRNEIFVTGNSNYNVNLKLWDNYNEKDNKIINSKKI